MNTKIHSEIVDEILGSATKYEKETGKRPTSVRLTPELKCKIESLTYSDIGSPSRGIFQKGAREELSEILGFKITGWDSDNIEFE